MDQATTGKNPVSKQAFENQSATATSATEDRQVIQRIRSGDASAFEALFHAHYSRLFRFLLHFTRSTDLAEELVQELFTSIWTQKRDFNPRGSLRPYLFKMAKNLALDHIRHHRVLRMKEGEILDELLRNVKTPDEQLDNKLLLEELQRAIKKLPHRCRLIFIMSRYDGLKYAEIANILAISKNTVETQISRALKAVRKHLATYLDAI